MKRLLIVSTMSNPKSNACVKAKTLDTLGERHGLIPGKTQSGRSSLSKFYHCFFDAGEPRSDTSAMEGCRPAHSKGSRSAERLDLSEPLLEAMDGAFLRSTTGRE